MFRQFNFLNFKIRTLTKKPNKFFKISQNRRNEKIVILKMSENENEAILEMILTIFDEKKCNKSEEEEMKVKRNELKQLIN